LVFSDEIWTVGPHQFPAMRAAWAGELSCWKTNPVGSRRLLEENDNLVIIHKQNKLLFVKASL